MPKFFGKNHCSGDNRTGQSTATGLVDAGNARDTVSAQLPFMTESTAPIHRRNHPQITQISHKKIWSDGLYAVPKLDETELVPPLFSYRCRFLAFAGADVV